MPEPAASAETVGWWEAAAAHRLVVQRCTDCGHTRHPPGPVCPRCRSLASEWSAVAGTGTVYTYTVVRQAFIPSLQDKLPYVVIVVELDGANGARIVSNLVDVEPEEVTVGMPVEVVWEDMGPELAVPRFRWAPTSAVTAPTAASGTTPRAAPGAGGPP
jgi:uncharacterized protein